MDIYVKYLLEYHCEDISNIITSDGDAEQMSIYVDMTHLQKKVPQLFERLHRDAWEERRMWNAGLMHAQQKVIENDVFLAGATDLRSNSRVILHNLPADIHLSQQYPGKKQIGKLVQLKGSVMRISKSIIIQYKRMYTCTKCKKTSLGVAQYYQEFAFARPPNCPDAFGPQRCHGTMRDMSTPTDPIDPTKYMQYQEFLMQEYRNASATPNVMTVTIEDDMVDICDAGDRVAVCGVLDYQFKFRKPHQKTKVRLLLRAISVWNEHRKFGTKSADEMIYAQLAWQDQVERDGEAKLLETLVESFAPKTMGMQCIKLALCIAMCSGGTSEKSKFRQNSHILLIGDPSIGKSSLMTFAAEITPRSVFTTGVGSSQAGLTASVKRENGSWHVDAGALVLADGGICFIDEFNRLSQNDMASLHESMEQQTLSIAKAGLVCTRRTQCSVIAAMNPKSDAKGDTPEEKELASIGLRSPLLSRFDLIFLLMDEYNEDWDGVLGKRVKEDVVGGENNIDSNLWDVAKVQAHFEMIRDIQPQLLGSTKKIIDVYYQLCRETYTMHLRGRTTVRLHNSLERLTKAHAKLMVRTQATIVDATAIIYLIESSWGYGEILQPIKIISGALKYPTEEMIDVLLKALSLTREDVSENTPSQPVPKNSGRPLKRKECDDTLPIPQELCVLVDSQFDTGQGGFVSKYSEVFGAIDKSDLDLSDPVNDVIKENHDPPLNPSENNSFLHSLINLNGMDLQLD